MATFETIKLDKGLYRTPLGINAELERIDPSENYKGTSLEGLDAFERQLKRFDIKVKGSDSSSLEKFFQTSDSAVLFPEYINRAVRQGLEEANSVESLIACHTNIDSLDYRTIYSAQTDDDKEISEIAEGAQIPEMTIKTKENLVTLKKRGKMLTASYEAIRFQRLDLFGTALKQIGKYIAAQQVADAVTTLTAGSVAMVSPDTEGKIAYTDLIKLWNELDPYSMNTLICSPLNAGKILLLPEMRDAAAGLNFHATGKTVTPLGANIVKTTNVGDSAVLALDKNYALEMVTAGGIQTDFDKLIDRQIHRASITQIYGFSKIFDEATIALEI